MRILIPLFVLPLCFSSCKRLDYEPEFDFVYEWKGTFRAEEFFYQDPNGCVGSLNACNGYGEAQIKMNPNKNSGGYDIFFYYNGRLVKKLVTIRSEESLDGKTYYDESGNAAFIKLRYFHSTRETGFFVESFPIIQDEGGQKFMNYFDADF